MCHVEFQYGPLVSRMETTLQHNKDEEEIPLRH